MMALLKLLGKGLLYILLLPLGLAFFILYGIYLFIVWIVMFFRTIILFFRGKETGLNLPEDQRALELLNDSRDFREPITQPQPSVQQNPGVTLNFNLNGQKIDERKGSIVHSKEPNIIDYSDEESEGNDNE